MCVLGAERASVGWLYVCHCCTHAAVGVDVVVWCVGGVCGVVVC